MPKEKKTASKKPPPAEKLSNKDYERELTKLQAELVKIQFWAKDSKARIVVVFEGRDAAGKGDGRRLSRPARAVTGARLVAFYRADQAVEAGEALARAPLRLDMTQPKRVQPLES